jgi:hypothetical protein
MLQVDTSALEDRHRIQLKELEEAMKSTWEDKSRISEQYESERKRLEMEQRKSMRQLEVCFTPNRLPNCWLYPICTNL